MLPSIWLIELIPLLSLVECEKCYRASDNIIFIKNYTKLRKYIIEHSNAIQIDWYMLSSNPKAIELLKKIHQKFIGVCYQVTQMLLNY